MMPWYMSYGVAPPLAPEVHRRVEVALADGVDQASWFALVHCLTSRWWPGCLDDGQVGLVVVPVAGSVSVSVTCLPVGSFSVVPS